MMKRGWMIQAVVIGALVIVAMGQGSSAPSAQGQTNAPAARSGPRPYVTPSITLEEAQIIVNTAVEYVKEKGGYSAAAVVDANGNLVSFARMDGVSQTFQRFAVGKAVGAVALQQTTTESADQYRSNPSRILSALSLLQGEVVFIQGGYPLIVDNRIVGGAGAAGFNGKDDAIGVERGIAAWEKFRASKK